MSYRWTEAVEGPMQAEKIPTGFHKLRIVKVIHAKRSGERFESSNGDPQMMVVFADLIERECIQMFTLSEKAGWTLARLLECAGDDLKELERQGIEPRDFAEPAFAKKKLVGLSMIGYVEWERGDDDKEYSRVDPKKPDELSKRVLEQLDAESGTASTTGPHAPIDDSDIPF